MSEQLVFKLPHRAAQGADDFLVSDCNATAVRLIDAWPDWTNPAYAIVGPAASGKSHLANVWRLGSGARCVGAGDVRENGFDVLTDGRALVVEDADRAEIPDRTLFHLLNLCKERNVSLLLTARRAPADWRPGLPDLASRLRSIPSVTIGEPDDDLLRAVLLKQFADRQLDVAPRVIAYLASRMERSMDEAGRIVERLDHAALEAGRKLTRQFAREVLDWSADEQQPG